MLDCLKKQSPSRAAATSLSAGRASQECAVGSGSGAGFASLPTGASADALARAPRDTKIVDIGGDHRYVDGWAYGLADVWPAEIEGRTRVANPGCFPAAALNALAPLLANKLIEPGNIVIDAKTGVSGAGRGGESKFGYAESNENLIPYGLLKHVHMPEMDKTIERLL